MLGKLDLVVIWHDHNPDIQQLTVEKKTSP